MPPHIAALIEQGDYSQAELALSAWARSEPANPNPWIILGQIAGHGNRPQVAATHFRRVLALSPRLAVAAALLSQALKQLGRLEESLFYAELAADWSPLTAECHANLADMRWFAYRMEEGLSSINRALALRPGVADWMVKKLRFLRFMGHHSQANELARSILAKPDHSSNIDALNCLVESAASSSDWASLPALQSQLETAYRATPPKAIPLSAWFFLTSPVCSYNRSTSANPITAKRLSPPDSKLRIGYLSADYRDHPVAEMLAEVLPYHNRKDFEIHLISTGAIVESHLTRRLAHHADNICSLSHRDDANSYSFLKNDCKIDVLIDLMGGTKGERSGILALRPCPIQFLWLGCPATTGGDYYDAVLLDQIVAPQEFDCHFSEPIARLPSCYHPIGLGHHDELPSIERSELGLPDGVILAGMPQSLNRFRPPFLEQLAKQLSTIENLHLTLKIPGDKIGEIKQFFAGFGVSPSRIHPLPYVPNRATYFASLKTLDFIIDTFPYGGHSTCGEALTLGLPIVTHLGPTVPSRVASSMLRHLGLDHMAHSSQDDMFDYLRKLCCDPGFLNEQKKIVAFCKESATKLNGRIAANIESLCSGSFFPKT